MKVNKFLFFFLGCLNSLLILLDTLYIMLREKWVKDACVKSKMSVIWKSRYSVRNLLSDNWINVVKISDLKENVKVWDIDGFILRYSQQTIAYHAFAIYINMYVVWHSKKLVCLINFVLIVIFLHFKILCCVRICILYKHFYVYDF